MNFDEKPDYNYLRSLFKGLLSASGYENDGKYDWILKKEGQENMVAAMKTKDEKKAPLPRPQAGAAAAHHSNSRQQLIDNRETRKDFRANTGAQVLSLIHI